MALRSTSTPEPSPTAGHVQVPAHRQRGVPPPASQNPRPSRRPAPNRRKRSRSPSRDPSRAADALAAGTLVAPAAGHPTAIHVAVPQFGYVAPSSRARPPPQELRADEPIACPPRRARSLLRPARNGDRGIANAALCDAGARRVGGFLRLPAERR